jgi:polyhydroxybutyrate depolymerase
VGKEVSMSRSLAAVLFPVVLAACAAEAAEEADPIAGASGSLDGQACWGGPIDAVRTLTVGGMARTYRIHTPAHYGCGEPVPVVFNFHGFSSSGLGQAVYSAMIAKADEQTFIAVHPDGYEASWNAGTCCMGAMAAGIDDVAFVRAMLDDVRTLVPVDEGRLFATGMSNGGMLVHRLACEMSDVFAAVASVAGSNHYLRCAPEEAVPILHIHGTADRVVPYAGGLYHPNVPRMMADWAVRNGCGSTRTVSPPAGPDGDVTCESWDGCPAGIDTVLCTVEDGGHTWPGAFPVPLLGRTSRYPATDAIWDFFAAHGR